MVFWIRDVVLMKLEKKPSPLKTAAGNVGVSGQRSGGFDCVKTCKKEKWVELVTAVHFKPSPGRQSTHTAPASMSANEEVSLDVFVPTPIATF